MSTSDWGYCMSRIALDWTHLIPGIERMIDDLDVAVGLPAVRGSHAA